jgi:hypothetical protein
MPERVISFLLSAKDATASAFDRAKGGVKDLAADTQRATQGMKAAHEAVAKAMRGDLVGAAQSAASAVKALWSVVLSNPLTALVAVLAAVALAMYKWTQSQKEAAEAARSHAIEVSKLQKSLDDLTLGTFMEGVGKTIKQMVSTKDMQALKDELAEQEKQFKQNAEAAQEYVDKLAGMNKPEDKMSQREKWAKENAESDLSRIEQRMKDNKAAIEAYNKAIEDMAAGEMKAAEEALAARQKEAEELAKIQDQITADLEEALADRNAATADALEESTRLAEEQLKAERQARKEAAEQAVKDAEDAAKAAAEAYQKAKTEAEESFRRATDNEYRRQQEKKEKDESRAAEKAARAYEVALEKSKKGIRGKHIDAALKATADSFKELEALDNQIRAQDAQAQAEKELNDAVLATAWNTKTIADKIEDSLKPA